MIVPPATTHLTHLTDAACSARQRGFTLLETTIAIGVLGIGLIMVAAIFPVALAEHRQTADRVRALAMFAKADAMLHSRHDARDLWVDPFVLAADVDSPWYMLPTANVIRGANATGNGVNNWNNMVFTNPPAYSGLAYADVANGVSQTNNGDTNANYATNFPNLPPHNPLTPLLVFGLDMLEDRLAPYSTNHPFSPFSDAELMAAADRMVSFGFYRRPAGGEVQYAAAVCRQGRNDVFAAQDMTAISPAVVPTAQNPFSFPTQDAAGAWRLPVPWRVSIAWLGGNVLTNAADNTLLGGGEGLARLAPIGSKMMVMGLAYVEPGGAFVIPSGAILTVTDHIDDFTVEFIGETHNLPLYSGGVGSPLQTFDVWLFAPDLVGNAFHDHSPVIDWKVPL